MAILDFQKPDKIIMLDSSDFEGKFEFRPLEPGYGLTVGNALRRVLLSSLDGYAISSLRIEGVEHEFSTISGVVEDVTEIVLNLKQIRFKRQIDTVDGEKISVNLTGKQQLKAGDLQESISGFQVLNPDLLICNLDPKVELRMEMNIIKGRGYVAAEDNKQEEETPLGTIIIDSIFTPIKNVKYSIENYRVEQKTDYEKLIFSIETDGSVTPLDALTSASRILIQHFVLVSDELILGEEEAMVKSQAYDTEFLQLRQLLGSKLTDLGLSVRALNCLRSAELETLGDLVAFEKEDLLKFRNFGKKSLTELEELVDNKDLKFGMDLSKYDLDSK